MKEQIRELLHAAPFVPSLVHLAERRDFRVDHPDFVLAPPSKQPWITIEGFDNGCTHHISTLLIGSIEAVRNANLAA